MTTLRFICFALTILTIALVGSGCPRRTDDSNNQDKKLLEAARNGDAEIVQQLLRGGARVGLKNENGETALDLAAMQGDRDIVSLLLEAKIDTVNKNEALFWAAGNEPLVLIKNSKENDHLQDIGFNPIDKNYADVVKLLLDKGAEIEARDEDRATPLIRAASHGETGGVKLLLDRGAEIEARDQGGETALHRAACECAVIDMPDTLGAIKLLLEKGANVEARDNEGNTPLLLAAGWGRTENVKFLLENHAKLAARDNAGNTAFLVSSSGSAYPTVETVKFLLDHGAKIEEKNKQGDTALVLAASGDGGERVAIVKLLLDRGANPKVKDFHGNTALVLAEKKGNLDIVPLLGKAMAASH